MADFYWIGGSGEYGDGTHWSETSGGPEANQTPGENDNIFFDGNSGLPAIVNLSNGAQFCKNFTVSTTASLQFTSVGANFVVSGNVSVLPTANVTFAGYAVPQFTAWDAGSYTMDWGGATLPSFEVHSNGFAPTVALSGDLVAEGYVYIEGGDGMTFNGNGKNIRAKEIAVESGASGGITILMGTGEWEATGNNVSATFSNLPFSFVESSATAPLTINKGSSSIVFSDSVAEAHTFSYTDTDGIVKGKAWGKLKIKNGNGTTSYEIVGEHSWDDIISEDQVDNYAIKFEALTTQTFDAFHLSGVPNKLIEIRSTTPGDAVTFSVASGTVSIDYVDIKDVAATGGATWIVGANSNDGGGNTGFTFTPDVAAVLTVTPMGELKSNPITIRIQHNGDAYDTTGGLGLADGSIPVASWAIVLQDLYGGLYFGPSHAFTDLDVTDSFTLPYGEYQDIYVVGQYGNGEYSQTSNEYLIYSVVSPSAIPFSVVINPGVKPKTKRDNTKTHIINSNLSGKKFPGPKGTTPLVVDCQLMQSELGDALASFTPDWETVGTTIENDTSTLNGGVIVARGYNYDKLMKFHAHKKQQFKSDGVLDPTRTAYFIAFYQTVDPETGVPSYGRRELAAFRPVMDKEKIRVPSNNPSDIEDDDDDGDYEEEKYGRDFYSAGILPQYTREWFIVLCFGELPAAGPFTDGDYPYSNDSSRYATLTNGWWEVKTGVRRVV